MRHTRSLIEIRPAISLMALSMDPNVSSSNKLLTLVNESEIANSTARLLSDRRS